MLYGITRLNMGKKTKTHGNIDAAQNIKLNKKDKKTR